MPNVWLYSAYMAVLCLLSPQSLYGSEKAAEAVFYRAVQQCPWAKVRMYVCMLSSIGLCLLCL